jgi:chitinase
VYDPATRVDTVVALPATPTCVSVSPDGLTAVVGHNAYVTHVDLTSATVLNTWDIAINVYDIVLAGNGIAYALGSGGGFGRLHALNLSTGVVTQSTGNLIGGGTLIALHPSGTSIYGAGNFSSPSDIEKYDISSAVPTYLYNSPYHGDFPMGGNVWMWKDGTSVLSRWATRFSTTSTQATDIIYQGRLAQPIPVVSSDHSTGTGRVVALLQSPFSTTPVDDNRVHWFDDLFLQDERAAMLPRFDVGGTKYAAHGKFVFFSADGSKVHVVVMADVTSGLLNDYAVVTFD